MENKRIDLSKLEVGRLYIEGIEEKWREEYLDENPFAVEEGTTDNPFIVLDEPEVLEESMEWKVFSVKVQCLDRVVTVERYVRNHTPDLRFKGPCVVGGKVFYPFYQEV